jgi:hypothetical protein
MSAKLLAISKSIDKRLWPSEHPLRQFPILTYETMKKLEARNFDVERLRDMSADEIGMLCVFDCLFVCLFTMVQHQQKSKHPSSTPQPPDIKAHGQKIFRKCHC